MMTIGHSTLEIEIFLRALKESGVKTLVDVRRFPGSKRHPQFGQSSLFASLADVEIRGVWREGLGGRRSAAKNSVNTGWKNAAFRGYADYMQTPEFEREMDWLMALPELAATVVMCAEAVPWAVPQVVDCGRGDRAGRACGGYFCGDEWEEFAQGA
jgi:uncharacterized protein (DUF488 family)